MVLVNAAKAVDLAERHQPVRLEAGPHVALDVVGSGRLIVLDADTLDHVPGSPSALPKYGVSLVVY